jgi:MSHA pilin protein MshA
MNTLNQMVANKEKGFTLIELVMVIVILGILAAFALPRFADLGGDARASVFQGAVGFIILKVAAYSSIPVIVCRGIWGDSSY